MHRLAAALLVPAVLLVALADRVQAADKETWFEATTENFVLYTDTGRDSAVELVEDIERFRFTVGLLGGVDLSATLSPPLEVFAYAKQRDYTRRYDMEGTAGFYFVRSEGPVTVLSLEDGKKNWEIKGRQVLYHEYTHHLLHQYSPYAYPRWYDEGFAEFLSTIEFEGDIAVIGHPPVHRFLALKKAGDWLKLRELVESKGRYIGYMGSGLRRHPDRYRVGLPHQYAQGWLVTHFLNNSQKFREGLSPYLIALNQPGVDEKNAFESAFGVSYSEMDTAVRKYWYSYQLPIKSLDLSGSMPEIAVDVRQMHAAEAAAVDYEGRLLTGKIDGDEDKAAAAFRTVLDAGVRERRMREYLARLAAGEKAWGAAHEQVDAILAKAADHAPALTLKARLLRAELGDEPLSAEQVKTIRGYCLRAIKAQPTYVPALLAFADLALVDGQPVDTGVLKVLESIRFLAPDLEPARILEARILAKAGRIEEARAVMQGLIDWSANRSDQTRFEKLLKEIEADAAARKG